MRISMYVSIAALGVAAVLPSVARAQVYATSVTASFPDANGKVPALNAVPGAGIDNWAMGLAQAVLTQGHIYNYCVSLGSGNVGGKASVSYSIKQGSTVVQSGTIIDSKHYQVGANGIWYFCSGYTKLPVSPGVATLTATVAFTATGTKKPVQTKTSTQILLQ